MSRHVHDQTREHPGLFDALGVFRRHYLIVSLGLVLGLAAACGFSLCATDIYESTTRILIVKKGATVPGPTGDASGEFEQTVQEDLLATHMLILRSPRVVQQALEKYDLQNLPSIQASLKEDQDAVDYVIENLRVTRGGEGQGRLAHVITLRLHHTSDRDCATVLNAIVESYYEFTEQQLAAPVDDAVKLISEAKRQISNDLSESLANYQEFRETTALIFKGAERLNVHQARVEQLESALAEVRLRRVETQSRIETAESMMAACSKGESGLDFERLALLEQHHFDSPQFTAVDSSNGRTATMLPAGRPELTERIKIEFNQLLTMKLEEGALLEEFGSHHPLVRQKRKNIEQMERFLEQKRRKLENAFVQLLHSDLTDLKRREQEIRHMLQEERESARALVKAELQDDAMRKEIDRQQTLFDSVVKRLDETHLARNYGGFASEVIAPVKLGELVSPGSGLIMSLGTVMGLFFGLGLAVVVEYLPTSTDASQIAPRRQTVHATADLPMTMSATV